MLTIDALRSYGADTPSGLQKCFGDEHFYLGMVEMLICDEKFDLLAIAIQERNIAACLHIAYALVDVAYGLALAPLAEQSLPFPAPPPAPAAAEADRRRTLRRRPRHDGRKQPDQGKKRLT